MVGYHRETHHFREEKSTKELTFPQHTRFILPLTSPDKIHRCAAWAVFFFYGHLSGRRPLHLANARPFGRSKAPLGLSLLRNRGILLSKEHKKSEPFSYREKVRIFIIWCRKNLGSSPSSGEAEKDDDCSDGRFVRTAPLPPHSKCTVRTLGSNVTIQMVGSVFVLYCEIPTRQ